MSKFSSFVELLVKQTCRRASHEYEMAKSKGKLASEDHSLYSLEFLKSLHDQPRENILRLLKKPSNLKITNGLQWLNSSEFTKAEKNILLEFLIKVKDMSPIRSQKWIDLQHYLHYVYRNFANANPDPSTEALSSFFISEMTELVKSLIEEDESQLYLRVLAILREYCIFAQWNYSKQNDNQAITKLFYYYEAMLTAAKNLSSVFTEFEAIISKNYSLGWIDFNTSVFIRYFFQTEFVQHKITQCLKTRLSPGDTPAMFELLDDLKNLWIKEEIRVRKINENAAIDNSFDYYYIEEAMINCHKKVLTCNFWVERSQKDKDDLDLTRLDHHIFRLLSDPLFHPAGPILDRHGQCICEECLIAKYKCMLDSDGDHINEKVLKNVSRLTYCRRCLNLVSLDLFHGHINSHSDTQRKHSQLVCATQEKTPVTDRVDGKLRNGSIYIPEAMKTETKKSKKEQQPVIKTRSCNAHSNLSNGKTEMDCTKLAFEQYLKSRNDAVGPNVLHKPDSLLSKTVHKNETLLNKTVHDLIKMKKDIFCQTNDNNPGKVFVENVLKPSSQTTLIQKKKEILSDVESKVRERKNGHKFDKSLTATCKSLAPTTCDCEKVCKHDEDCKSASCCGLLCEHHDECSYCDMFGTSPASHNHKSNELRDRLRIRLHQRREKRSKDSAKILTNTNSPSNVKVKTVISKVEERVPLPSSPTNIPPAPVVKSSESSATSSNDIHGLVNYIEGNPDLNKMQLAEKKAAKKARQRQKKEEERLKQEEDRRKLEEEIKRKEAEKARELARAIAEKEKAKKAAQAKTTLKPNANKPTTNTVNAAEKKRAKKERRAQRKAEALAEINKENNNVIEQTIPAMVTIKRIAENGGGSPTVTITLKGSTPDQDKLLYTLVGGADQTVPAPQLENETITKKKRKKNAKANVDEKPVVPTVITKEVKVTVSLDATVAQDTKKTTKKDARKADKASKHAEIKEVTTKDLSFPMLRLPPGITITKVEAPVSNRNYQVGNVDQKNSALTVGAKSGVIVVDTEKLIQNKKPSELETKTKTGKNNKKKNKKKIEQTAQSTKNGNATKPQNGSNNSNSAKKMITLKNPIFQPFNVPKTEPNTTSIDKNDSCAPAAIFTNENGMVTIRSSRLQQSLAERGCVNPMPVMPITSFIQESSKPNASPIEVAEEKSETITSLNAQEILSGLPGIEITKVDKKAVKPEPDRSCQAAQVSIIPTPSNGNDQFSFDNDDWFYDNVFNPRDVLEDDMDAEELELEAFKRFCQQSIPPLRKEKVTHLNVADIVLKKKTDNCV